MQAGCDWYYFTFPIAVDCSNIIFNSGSGIQTPDLLNRCDDGYYQVGIGWSSNPPSGYCGNPPPSVTVSPAGPYNNINPFVVTINIYDNTDPSPIIYYTLDGSNPTISSQSGLDGMTLNIAQNTTVKVMGVDANGATSVIQTYTYTVGLQPPLMVFFKKPTTWANAKIHYWSAIPTGSIANTAWQCKYDSKSTWM
ncbi:MAG: chitobiase/beta-hexosaminidase C-terminal domain-containing protein [Saprospiraceae bacterium]|nr:chitobiase/beta-hexosaminidase C-terminal domain-containing protein [Saprospiraceae bacterium]